MKTIQITNNDKLVKQFSCPEKLVSKYWEMAVDIAGGMWRSWEDNIIVKIID